MLIEKHVILNAARSLLVQCILDKIEDPNGKLDLPEEYHSVGDLADHIVEHHEGDVLFIMGYMMGSASVAWGKSINLVFYHAGFLEDDDMCSEALYRLFMGCFGHGIAIDDDAPNGPMSAGLKRAAKNLLKWSSANEFDSVPCNFDQHVLFSSVVVMPYLDEE